MTVTHPATLAQLSAAWEKLKLLRQRLLEQQQILTAGAISLQFSEHELKLLSSFGYFSENERSLINRVTGLGLK